VEVQKRKIQPELKWNCIQRLKTTFIAHFTMLSGMILTAEILPMTLKVKTMIYSAQALRKVLLVQWYFVSSLQAHPSSTGHSQWRAGRGRGAL
jgi:hypothetical protein